MTIANTAAALAPTLTPMMSGLASGLRSVVWKIAPPTPNAMPTSTPSTARGSLLSIRMNDAPGISSPKRIRKKSGMVNGEVAEQHPGGEGQQQHHRQPADDQPRAGVPAASAPPGRSVDRRGATPRRAARDPSRPASERPHPTAPDQPQEHRDADDRGHDPDLHLGRRQHHPADGVGEGDQHGAAHRSRTAAPWRSPPPTIGAHAVRRRSGRRTRSVRPAPWRRRRAARTASPMTRRSRVTWRPSPRARSSPSARALSSRAPPSASRAPRARNGSAGAGARRSSRPPTVPTCQNRKLSIVFRSVSRMPEVQLDTAAVSAAPAIASLTGVAPSRPSEATRARRPSAIAAPEEREPDVAPRGRRPRGTRSPAPSRSDAPALMPRMPGSASGLRVSPCMQAPARPSAAPTASAEQVRPNRAIDDRVRPGRPGRGARAGETARRADQHRERRRRPAPPRRAGGQRRCWSAPVRRWPRRPDAVSRTRVISVPSTACGDLGQEVLDDERDRERRGVGHREADVLVLLGVGVARGRAPGSGRSAGRRRTSPGRRRSRRRSAGRRSRGARPAPRRRCRRTRPASIDVVDHRRVRRCRGRA